MAMAIAANNKNRKKKTKVSAITRMLGVNKLTFSLLIARHRIWRHFPRDRAPMQSTKD